MNAQSLVKKLKTNHVLIFAFGLALIFAIWFVFIIPTMNNNAKLEKAIPNQKEELLALRELGGQIRALENSLVNFTPEQKQAKNETILKQIERLAKEAKVFNSITNIAPGKIRKAGKDIKTLTMEFEETNLAKLSPFLQLIGHKSLLEMQEIEMRRTSTSEGAITARITVIEAGI